METYVFKTITWIRIALINFCIVALAGITMRYKINFPLPVLNQKYLLHAHSHFAFTGWIALILMVLMVNYLQQQNVKTNYKKYNRVMIANCVTAYGMFVSFIAEGYAFYSISFSTLSIFISYFFIFYLWRDLNKVKDKSYAPKWFKTALVLWAISSLGAFALAFLMGSHNKVQDYYFGAVYFFLHFQYNGWFLFACFGLLFSCLHKKEILSSVFVNKKLFAVMTITVGPAYFLSILWLKLPLSMHILADVSGVMQLLILFYFVKLFPLIKKNILDKLTAATKYLWAMVFIAFIIKIILQMLSVIPFFSGYAFGFRPIVIGYLHLSFLGIISFFILGYIFQLLSEGHRRFSKPGVFIFVTGVLLQEIVLMMQGFEVIEFEPLPHADIILFCSSIVMGLGLIWITFTIGQPGRSKETTGIV